MAQMYYGSLNLSDILKNAKLPHSAFVRAGKENKAFVNVQIWINEEPDKYGNHVSIKLNSKDIETGKIEGNVYIGQAKKSERKEPEQMTAESAAELDEDDSLPF